MRLTQLEAEELLSKFEMIENIIGELKQQPAER